MAESLIQYDFENRKEFQQILKNAASQISDLSFPMGEISRDFYISERAIFKLQSPGGFPDFKNERSKKQKLSEVGFLYPLLKRSGKLEKSITEEGSPGNITKITSRDATVGTNISYAKFHQNGTRLMSARRFVFIGPESRAFSQKDRQKGGGRLTRWSNIIENYVQVVLKNQGFETKRSR